MAIKHYKVTLTTLGPVHIGNGNIIGKKDYFISNNNTYIIDPVKFFKLLSNEQKKQYENFLEDESLNLSDFIMKNSLFTIAMKCIHYEIHGFKPEKRRNRNIYHDVNQFIRDGQGNPYVPGSSLKGVIRTTILGYIVSENPSEYFEFIDSNIRDYGSRKLEDKVFLKGSTKKNEVTDNNLMKYISVSDSQPLRNEDLIFAKKFDLFSIDDPKRTTKEGNELNIYQECIKPGVSLTFQIDIDEDNLVFKTNNGDIKIDASNLILLIRNFYWHYNTYVLEHFESIHDDGDEVIYIGGGTGFSTKTVNLQLYKENNANRIAQILYKQFPTKISDDYKYANELRREVKNAGFNPQKMHARGRMKKNDHRHWQYKELGVAPHTLKCAKHEGLVYEYGKCKIKINEIID